MNLALNLPVVRFLDTLEIVTKEGKHLSYSWNGLFAQPIDVEWVKSLELHPDRAEQLEAFVSRFGRMQDTTAYKLLPRWLLALAARPGSLGVLTSTEKWLEARNLRNRLVHEYITDPAKFAEDLAVAKEYCLMLVETFNHLRQDALTRMGHKKENLPEELPMMIPLFFE